MCSGATEVQPAGNRWDPGQYHRFTDHRLRPALDLLARVPVSDASVVYDLGCGSGNVTRVIAERFPAARVAGIDTSREMLSKAAETTGRIEWIRADIAEWEPGRSPDLIYSNAALHWIDGHAALFPRLFGFLAPGGCLAVQMPLSHSMPSHVLMRETLAAGGADGSRLGDEALAAAVGRKWVLDAGEYHDLLAPEASSLDIWETEYLQRLEGDDPVLEWVRGTGLRPILSGLCGSERDRFVEVYRERLRMAYPRHAGGHTLYPFRRLFMVAMRGDRVRATPSPPPTSTSAATGGAASRESRRRETRTVRARTTPDPGPAGRRRTRSPAAPASAPPARNRRRRPIGELRGGGLVGRARRALDA